MTRFSPGKRWDHRDCQGMKWMKRAEGGGRKVCLFIGVEGDACHLAGANNFVSLFVDKLGFIATNT